MLLILSCFEFLSILFIVLCETWSIKEVELEFLTYLAGSITLVGLEEAATVRKLDLKLVIIGISFFSLLLILLF
jgi:hypothetical protein